MSEQPPNFGHLVASIIQKEADDVRARHKAEEAERRRYEEVYETQCSTLLKAMRQTKSMFPAASIEADRTPARFYNSAHTSIRLVYKEEASLFQLVRSRLTDEVLITSDTADDLLPMLLEQLAVCVKRTL